MISQVELAPTLDAGLGAGAPIDDRSARDHEGAVSRAPGRRSDQPLAHVHLFAQGSFGRAPLVA